MLNALRIFKLAVSLDHTDLVAKGSKVAVIATGDATVPALHAVALEPNLFEELQLSDRRTSWVAMLEESQPKRCFEDVIHGALKVYDLPNLEKLCGKKLLPGNK